MKGLKSYLLPAVPIVLILGTMIFSHSCANTTTPPSGGPKDTIPPVITAIYPPLGATNIPTNKTKLILEFNEYVVVKDAKSIYLSPPQEKMPTYKIKNKSVVISFEEPLDSNRTYTLDVTNAIFDNNEGNPFPGFALYFSTGDVVDSMMVTGLVQDCSTLEPVKGATVMLYKDHADSAVFLKRPDASVKTDKWGFFCLRNIQDTVYRMYAIIDENNNNKYDPDNDRIAFIDSLVSPLTVVDEKLPELMKYDMEDTVHCLARKTEYELSLFREKPSKQMIINKERVGDRSAYITFNAPYTQLDSIWIEGVPEEQLITQFNIMRDSLEIWVNDSKPQPDTFYVNVKYMKTDSVGLLVSTVDELKLLNPNRKTFGKSSSKDIKHEDTIAVVDVVAEPETVEQYGFTIEFKYPLAESAFDSLSFRYLTPKQEEMTADFEVTQDSLNLRKYIVRPKLQMLPGYEYFLKLPHRKFKDINGHYNDSTEVKVSLPKDDKLSTMNLVLGNVNNKYIVDLLNEKRNTVLRSYIVDKDQTLVFPYLKAGKYSIRITEDVNKNGIVDTGNLLEHRQPEKVRFYKLEDGTFLIDIPEMTELEQMIDLEKMFR